MDLIRISIERPTAVIAAVLMVVAFGLVALAAIPIQLTPDVHKPVITISTNWGGAAPAEIEREIINRQEEKLKGLEGLEEMSSTSQDDRGEITLEFGTNQEMGRALVLVSNRLDQVESYPEEADKPTLRTSGSEDKAIAWIIMRRLPGNQRAIDTYGDFAEDEIKDRFERVPGVARSNVYGGSEKELKIIIDPQRLASYRLTVTEVLSALRAANTSMSAGDVEEGKRRYVVRTEGELNTIEKVSAVVLRSFSADGSDRLGRVTIGDVADIRFDYKEAQVTIRQNGKPAIAINIIRERGANVIDVMAGIKQVIADLDSTILPKNGLELFQVYDETVYINSAVDLVTQNIYLGGTLAAIILLLFLRSGRATLIASLAIPVSVIGCFVAMAALGRSLNVISLAGIAFAVGMVVDAAIVVLENIYRLRQEGKPSAQAAYEGTRQVWGAVLVSSLTTVLVFLPLLVMNLEVGQLFRDIAVAISVAVLLSLVVAATVLPALANRLLQSDSVIAMKEKKIPIIDDLASGFVRLIMSFTDTVTASTSRALATVAIICGMAGLVTYALLPKLEYLPEGNQNLVFGMVLPPPGYNLETTVDIASRIETLISPLWGEGEPSTPQIANGPAISNFFFVAWRGQTFLGARASDPSRVKELIPILSEPVFSEPGTFGFITQPSLFGRTIGGGRSIDLNISGPDLEKVLGVAVNATILTEKALPRTNGTQLRPKPGLELGAPEIRIFPDPVRLSDNDMSATDLGITIDAFNDGLRVAEVTVEGDRIDLTLQGPEKNIKQTQGVANIPVVTPAGRIVPVSSLSRIILTAGPTEIRHLERLRTVTLEIRPAPNMALEEAMEIIRAQVIAPMESGVESQGLPAGITLSLSGTSDELEQTWDAMVVNLMLALLIVYLVMAILFESFLYPLIILLSVPLATAGGAAGLALLNLFTFQPLDMLTLLGFVILVGIVVNNAILLVHQTLFHIRVDKMPVTQSIREATANRIRPIFMSTLTSVFGMMPLVVFPGAGSELYRGLGSVILGGLSLSALLTLIIVPPMLSVFTAGAEKAHHLAEQVSD